MDVLALLEHLAGVSVAAEACVPSLDLNCDGAANAGDVLSALRALATGPPYPPGCLT
jgi:hypothetical protein